MKIAPILILTVLAPMTVLGDDALITDRPDFTESSFVVPVGRVQVESGATYTRSGLAREHALGEILVRVPAGRRAELRLGAPAYLWQRDGARASGADDAFLGAKFALSPGGGKRPATALLIGTSLPTGAKSVSEKAWQPEVAVAASWDLSPVTAISPLMTWLAFSLVQSFLRKFRSHDTVAP